MKCYIEERNLIITTLERNSHFPKIPLIKTQNCNFRLPIFNRGMLQESQISDRKHQSTSIYGNQILAFLRCWKQEVHSSYWARIMTILLLCGRVRFLISGRYLTEFSDYDTKFPFRKH